MERRRFDMSLPVFLRTIGDLWRAGVTKTVSVNGAFVLSDRPLLLNADAEWMLSLPPELTKAKQPLMILFYGRVLQCEHVREGDFSFGIALQSRDYRYLPKEEAAKFGAMLEEMSATAKK
jgi:hypothetical protein